MLLAAAVASPVEAATPKAPTIVSVNPSKATVLTGSTLKFKITAENESKSKASAAHDLVFLLSKSKSASGAKELGAGTIPSLSPKKRKAYSFEVQIPVTAKAGDLRLLLCHPRPGKSLLCHSDNIKLKVKLAPAELTISPTSHDYGDVATNVGELKRFTIRNVGGQPSGAVAYEIVGPQASQFSYLRP